MTCIKICFFLILVAVFTFVLAQDCKELETCTCANIKTYLDALAPCTKDGKCLKENDQKKIMTPECEQCRTPRILANSDPWCVCLNKHCGIDNSTLKDSEKKKAAQKKYEDYVYSKCIGAFSDPKCQV